MKIKNNKRVTGAVSIDDEVTLYKVTGKDALRFLQGQTTNDLGVLDDFAGQYSTIIDLKGKVQSFFQIAKVEDFFYILVEKKQADKLFQRFEKYLIMDDVLFTKVDGPVATVHGVVGFELVAKLETSNFFHSHVYFDFAFFIWGEDEIAKIKKLDIPQFTDNERRELEIKSGWPVWGLDVNEDTLLNESSLNNFAVSYKKGCFMGQEVVAKIENNRKAAYDICCWSFNKNDRKIDFRLRETYTISGKKAGVFFDAVELNGNFLVKASVFRDYRVENKNYEIITQDGQVLRGQLLYAPLEKKTDTMQLKIEELYHYAVVEYTQQNNFENAKKILKLCIDVQADFSDAYEVLGAIYGQEGQYQDAINYMDKLLEVNPDSIMAYTNKSLYYMKLGKIEEAEDCKAQAMVKSFSIKSEESENQKKQVAAREQEQKDLEKREQMFLQILELDPKDEMANYGLGNIALKRLNFLEAKILFTKVINDNRKYSNAYLGLGKTLIELKEFNLATETFEEGASIAASNGEFMPANEMQALLVKLKKEKI